MENKSGVKSVKLCEHVRQDIFNGGGHTNSVLGLRTRNKVDVKISQPRTFLQMAV